MATKVKTGVIDSGAITSALITDASITADDLHTTLDLTGKTVTVATASASDNDTSVASTAYVTTAIANLADSAPSTLNTLNELAAALGDDENFSTTVTNSIATKLPLAGGTMSGALNMGSQNITNAGTIGSGDITSSGNITASGNSNSFGNTSLGSISSTGTITTTGGNIDIRKDGTGDGSNGYDINFMNSAAEGTDDRIALIRVTNQGGDAASRGGKLTFFTRKSGSSSFTSSLILDKDGNATVAGTINSGAITSTGLNSTAGTVQYADGGSSFDSSDADGYPRFSVTNGSAQLGLFRTGSSAGGMYIGGSADGFRVYTTGFAQKLLVDQSGNATFAGTISSGDITTTGNIQTGSFDASYGVGTRTTVDMTSLNESTWYPVTIPLAPTRRSRITIEVGLNSGSTPSWDTHPSGFSLHLDWTTIGSGWGTTQVVREIHNYTEAWNNGQIAGAIAQLGNSSYEYVYLRGGGKYHFRISHGGIPTVRSSTYTTNGQSVSPITSNIGNPWDADSAHANRKLNTLKVSDNIISESGTSTFGPYVYNSGNGVNLYGDTGRIFTDINYNTYGAEIILVNNKITSGVCSLLQYRTAGVTEGSISGSSTGLAISNVSDYRKKENIRDLTGSLSVIKSLQPRVYEYKEGLGAAGDHIGFIAHEIQEHIPKAVTGNKDDIYSQADIDEGASEVVIGDPKYQAVSYTHNEIITRLVQSIQELEARIAILESE